MNKIFIISLFVLLCSCGVYRYEIQNDGEIVSKLNNSITSVLISNNSGVIVSKFQLKEGKSSKVFSLIDFSSGYYKCISGCDFEFQEDSVYEVSVFPKGDTYKPNFFIKYSQNTIVVLDTINKF